MSNPHVLASEPTAHGRVEVTQEWPGAGLRWQIVTSGPVRRSRGCYYVGVHGEDLPALVALALADAHAIVAERRAQFAALMAAPPVTRYTIVIERSTC